MCSKQTKQRLDVVCIILISGHTAYRYFKFATSRFAIRDSFIKVCELMFDESCIVLGMFDKSSQSSIEQNKVGHVTFCATIKPQTAHNFIYYYGSTFLIHHCRVHCIYFLSDQRIRFISCNTS